MWDFGRIPLQMVAGHRERKLLRNNLASVDNSREQKLSNFWFNIEQQGIVSAFEFQKFMIFVFNLIYHTQNSQFTSEPLKKIQNR